MSMSERPEEPNQASDAESLLPIDEHVEEGHDAEGRKVRHRGIYLLPNLFTTANLFAGFYSIINSMSAQAALSAGDSANASKYFFDARTDERNSRYTFDVRWYYEQIPNSEIQKSQNLIQNPGY